MAYCRYLNSHLIIPSLCRPFSRVISPLRARSPFTELTRSLASQSMEEPSELFEYTSGRWMFVTPLLLKPTLITDYGLEL